MNRRAFITSLLATTASVPLAKAAAFRGNLVGLDWPYRLARSPIDEEEVLYWQGRMWWVESPQTICWSEILPCEGDSE